MLQVGQWIPGCEAIANMKKTPGQPSQGTIPVGQNSQQRLSKLAGFTKYFSGDSIAAKLLNICVQEHHSQVQAVNSGRLLPAGATLAMMFMNHQLLQILLLVCLNINNHRMT